MVPRLSPHLIADLQRNLLMPLQQKKEILADTRIKNVTLYDHLVLTAGISAAIIREQVLRNRTAADICGVGISTEDLVLVTRISSLMHDLGKVDDYRGHIPRGVEKASAWLRDKGIGEPFSGLIVSGIQHHQLDYRPETLLDRAICLADSIASGADRPELAQAETWEQMSRVAAGTLDLQYSIFADRPGLALVLGDVDKVKSYVFESSRLPEIRGASRLLDDLNRQTTGSIIARYAAPESLVYSGGGTFLAVAPVSACQEIIAEIERAYLRQTGIASITCVASSPLGYVDLSRGLWPYANDTVEQLRGKGKGVARWLWDSHFEGAKKAARDKKNFGELVTSLAAELRAKKDAKTAAPICEVMPVFRRCDSCGMRAAAEEMDYGEGGVRRLCHSCLIKAKEPSKHRFSDLLSEALTNLPCHMDETRPSKHRFSDFLSEGQRLPDFPRDLSQLAGTGGYVGFLYIDGNNMGALLEGAASAARYRHISQALQDGIEKALVGTFRGYFGAKISRFDCLPLDIIEIGGDDIIIILKSCYALPFSLNLLDSLAANVEALGEETQQSLSFSAGLFVGKKDYPVRFMERLADGLLKQAKVIARKTGENSLSYLYLTAQLATEDVEEIFDAYYSHHKGKNEFNLTMRPYTASEWRTVREMAGILKDALPASQRKTLETALGRGPYPSINYFLYQIGRMDNRKRTMMIDLLQDKMAKFLKRRSPGFDSQLFIWAPDQDAVLATPLLDMLETIKMEG